MTQKIDMSPDAVTGRMIALDQLWQLSVALRSSRIVEEDSTNHRLMRAACLSMILASQAMI